jgi:hypothetical protein
MALTKSELYILVDVELGELADSLTQEEINRAIDKGMIELGYDYPVAGLKQMWAVNRSKRHAIEILLLTASEDFKFNKLELQQPFEHLKYLVSYYDEQFILAQESQPELFPNTGLGIDPETMFGTYITNGFVYDASGNDITYLQED